MLWDRDGSFLFRSDHRPVFATFTLIPRSFKWGNYTEVGDSRLDLVLTDVVLDSQDLDAHAELQMVVSAPFVFEDIPSAFVKNGDFLDGWKWPELAFRAFVQPSHLSAFRLLVAVRAICVEVVNTCTQHYTRFFLLVCRELFLFIRLKHWCVHDAKP